MDEAIIKILSMSAELVARGGRLLMIAGGSDRLHFFTIALIFVLLAARLARRKRSGFSQSFSAPNTPANHGPSKHLFERKRIATQKPCPNCGKQLSLSALICDACDYNFLAERPERGQQLLPPPETHDSRHVRAKTRVRKAPTSLRWQS